MRKTPRDLADDMAKRRARRRDDGFGREDGFVRETFTQSREAARQTARAFLDRYPKAAYMSEVEHWRELPDGAIEFTMRRLRTAD
jgi:ribosomal protein S14